MDKVISTTGKEVFPLGYFKIKKDEWEQYEGRETYPDISSFMWALWGYHVPVYSREEGWPADLNDVLGLVFRDDIALSKSGVIIEPRHSFDNPSSDRSVKILLHSVKLFYAAHPELGRPPLLFKDARDSPTADQPQEEEKLSAKEKKTFLIIMRALMSVANVGVETPSASAVVIEAEASRLGLSIGKRTIENKINEAAKID